MAVKYVSVRLLSVKRYVCGSDVLGNERMVGFRHSVEASSFDELKLHGVFRWVEQLSVEVSV